MLSNEAKGVNWFFFLIFVLIILSALIQFENFFYFGGYGHFRYNFGLLLPVCTILLASILLVMITLENLRITPKIFAKSRANKNITKFFNQGRSGEKALFFVGSLIFITSFSELFNSYRAIFLIPAILMILFSYDNFSNREKIKLTITKILPQYKEIQLRELSRLLKKSPKDILWALTYVIEEQNFPAFYVFETKSIKFLGKFNGNEYSGTYELPNQQTDTKKTEDIKISKGIATKIACFYCEAVPVDSEAKYCNNCGSSLTPAK